MDVEVEEWTGQGVQKNGSYSVTSGKHLALWKKNLNQGQPLPHTVSLAHKVWLIYNYDFRPYYKKLQENWKAQAPMLSRFVCVCVWRGAVRNKEGKGYFWFSTIVRLILSVLKKNCIK